MFQILGPADIKGASFYSAVQLETGEGLQWNVYGALHG